MGSKSWKFIAVATLSIGVATPLGTTSSIAAPPASDTGVDTADAIVQLVGDPVSLAKEAQTPGKKVRWEAREVKNYRAKLSSQRNEFKRWLKKNAPSASVTGEFDVSLHAVAVRLNGTSLDTLRSSPLVVDAQYELTYSKLEGEPIEDPDLALIHAVAAWGTAEAAGAGVKVAIIDSGIDQNHPCFDDMGDDDRTTNNYTNNKVVVAKVFANRAASLGFDAKAVDSHGTHVAGTVACDYQTQAVVNGVTIPYLMSGVAPAALLGNYNVFPGTIANARSEDILNALDAAFQDGMDVANLSLGGNANGKQDLLTKAIDNLDRAGMVIAVASGNEGPGFSTVSSPGSAERALTAGASSVPHQVLDNITVPSGESGVVIDAVEGDFGSLPDAGTMVKIRVLLQQPNPDQGVPPDHPAGLEIACDPLAGPRAAQEKGTWAVIGRNVCDFTVKMRNVQAAGYAGAIVVNRIEEAFVLGQNGDPDQPTIPGVMVALSAASALKAADGATITFNPARYELNYIESNVMADFSSQGPTDVDRRIKPDVVAPGVNVLSAIPADGNYDEAFAFFNGTSMATPHLAGSAAVVIGRHADWDAWQVRSAIVNTANQDALLPHTSDDSIHDPNLVGNGLVDLALAVNAPVLLDPVSVSFGQIPGRSGSTRTSSITIQNTFDSAVTVSIAGPGGSGDAEFLAHATISPSDTAVVPVTMIMPKRAQAGPVWAHLSVQVGDGVLATAQLFVLVG